VSVRSILFAFLLTRYPLSLRTLQHETIRMRKGAIILSGGRSSRMGRDKATLRFGSEFMLQRVVRLLSEAVRPEDTVVVAAPNQSLPDLPATTRIVRDADEYRGPLQGLATGLVEMGDRFDAVYATACDVPLLVPAFVERMFQLLDEYDVAVPFDGQHYHSLAAVYRPQVLPQIQALLDADRLRPAFLFELVRTREVPVDNLRGVDPKLATLENLNRFVDYFAALTAAGFEASDETGETDG
jgi:molybdopterin-guanine dinucleotide biosynthesis protein A